MTGPRPLFKKHNPKPTTTKVGTPAGWARLGTITSIDQATMTAKVMFRSAQLGPPSEVLAQLPMSFISSNGGFIGGYVASGTPVVCLEAEMSGVYYIIAFLPRDPSTKSVNAIQGIDIPYFKETDVVIGSGQYSSLKLNKTSITMGEPDNVLTLDTDANVALNTFDATYTITQGTREIVGAIKRDVKPSIRFSDTLRLGSTKFDSTVKFVGMDPSAPATNANDGSSARNPTRIEKRELVLEYDYDANVQSNDIELKNYNISASQPITDYNFINRRDSQADTLSLSSVAPNYLIETTKGTVVDIFGNMLDLNRNIIPIGQNNVSVSQIKTTLNSSDTFTNAYEQIKREERKSIAFHFEINARKEEGVAGPVNVNDQTDYARSRSRFFLDIDKEGQLKLNVPASSDYGNIPLLTRYENYSTVYPNQKTNDPNTLMFDPTTGGAISRDILIDSFINNQVITLLDTLSTNAAPINRFSPAGQTQYLQHGTVYHNILNTCLSSQTGLSYYTPTEYPTPVSRLALGQVPGIQPPVSTTITVSGQGANAGGRSASLNFDGMVELNVGANHRDRQSLWADFEGGIVMNIGKDLPNDASLLASMDGQVLIEIGGKQSPQDPNFEPSTLTQTAGALDIRVWNGNGECTIFRIDQGGLQVTSPSDITYVCNGSFKIYAGEMDITADTLTIQARTVNKDPYAGQM